MDHAFGSGQPFTVGIEEELLLVEPDGHALAHEAERVLAGVDLPEGAAAHEAYAAEIELRSRPSVRAEEAVAALGRGRRAARATGATLMGAGVHPTAPLGDVRLVHAERYRRVLDSMRGLILRTPECALHVHVGMPDPASAVRAFNGLRRHLPLLAGLAANSPFWFGRDSGFASARGALVRAYPGRGVPAPLRDLEEWEGRIAAGAAGGGPADYTLVWWDVRLHPRLGTVEVRELDAQSSLDKVAGLAALVQALARLEAEPAAPPPPPSETIEWGTFAAVRDGLDARVPHHRGIAPLREVAMSALRRGRPYAREAGSEAALDEVGRMLREGGGAQRQRAAAARGGLKAVLELLLSETAAGTTPRRAARPAHPGPPAA
ncbi:MAG TPA: YbdK family carboxylate-amine ligase [Thermoleophilaceae bacterium]|nr:YbdK family carboxylate-amine ligase [Thermoleophilaceae bacterium]